MTFFRQFFYRGGVPEQQTGAGGFVSPFSGITRTGLRTLLTMAAFLIALGILVLVFPVVLAVFVAVLFFGVALICLRFAWRIYRASRLQRPYSHDVQVTIHEPPDERN